ncbi:MAG TPA: hypothetical protein V6D22_00510 [Candidatus Obscuribacterales bacterium]
MATLLVLGPAEARNIWDINHGMSNPPAAPGAQWHGPTKFDQSFWKGQLGKSIPSGTVLTAILENDISSNHSKTGDVFTLTLQDGFQLNGNVLIPPNSKIVGTVNHAIPAKKLRGGQPGRVDISLQALVFPDGQHQQIFANIDSNPNQNHKQPKVRHLGPDIRDYGEQVASMGLSFISGPGFVAARRMRGQDFHVDKGEALPIRLTQDLTPPPVQKVISAPVNNLGPGGIPTPRGVPASAPHYLDPNGPYRIPGFVPTTNGQPSPGMSSGGMNGAGMGAPGTGAPGMGATAAGTSPPADPNAVFNQPLSPPGVSNMSDPF